MKKYILFIIVSVTAAYGIAQPTPNVDWGVISTSQASTKVQSTSESSYAVSFRLMETTHVVVWVTGDGSPGGYHGTIFKGMNQTLNRIYQLGDYPQGKEFTLPSGLYVFQGIAPANARALTLVAQFYSPLFINPGAISGNQTVSPGETPAMITSVSMASGLPGSIGTISYQWQSSHDNVTWTNISGATALSYSPPALTQTTYYRRSANSDNAMSKSNTIILTMSGDIAGTPNTNYILNFTYTDENGETCIANAEYYDGFGRPVQKIIIDGSLDGGKDLVSFTEYDNMGRVSKSHLPFPVTSTNGRIVNNPAALQQSYYAGKYGTDGLYAYSSVVYENAPSAIPILSGSPGATHSVMGHPVKTEYSRYTGTNVSKYEVVSGNPLRIQKTYFPSGSLLEKKTSIVGNDANQSNITYEYVDSQGNIVATLDVNKQGTYYAYDDFGRLVATIPQNVHSSLPILPAGGSFTESSFIAGCPLNYYDTNGNLIKSSNPGSEYVINIYDNKNRLRMSQSGNLRETNSWAFTKYDALDRPVISGIHHGGTESTHKANLTGNSYSQNETRNTDRAAHFYTNTSYPLSNTSSTEVLTITYYDDYYWNDVWDDARVEIPTVVLNPGATSTLSGPPTYSNTELSNSVKGELTRTKNRVLGENVWLNTVIYYNDDYQEAEIRKELYPGGIETSTYTYNFVGDVTHQTVEHLINNNTFGYERWYEYDPAGRIIDIRQQMLGDTGNGRVTISSFDYDDLGRLVEKSIHNGLDETQFTTDINGRIKSVVSPKFSYELGYHTTRAGGSPRYDGKIAEMVWKNPDNSEKAYLYTYDRLGQLTKAQHALRGGSSFITTTTRKEEFTYASDLTGNITSISRTYNNATPQLLQMQYDGYRLIKTKVDSGNWSANYTYDSNGNMDFEGRDGSNHIYNILNRLESIDYGTSPSDVTMRATYSSSGEKLAVRTTDTNGSQTTYYRGEFTYIKPNGTTAETLSQVHHPEGIVTKTNLGYTYNYFKTDHVGNVRVLLGATGGPGLTVLQTNEYYAFGLLFDHNNLHYNKYLYNGKEFLDGVIDSYPGYYDFGSRTYNPFWGRWFQADPRNQFINPYLYCGNNPAMYVDPDGEFVQYIFGAIMGGLSGYNIGEANGAKGWGMFGYIMSGAGIGAATAGVGSAVTAAGGNAIAAGAAAGAVGGAGFGGMAGGWEGAIQGAAMGAINGMFSGISPLKVPFGSSGFSLGIAPQIAIGSDGAGFGFNATLGYNNKGFNVGVNAGGSYYASAAGTGASGFEWRLGYGIGYHGKRFQVGIGSTYFAGGGTSQLNGQMYLGGGKWRVTYENDTWAPVLGLCESGGMERDRFRTAAVNFDITGGKLKGLNAGLRIFTGLSDSPSRKGVFDNLGANRYRMGVIYAGYGNLRMGFNSERGIRGPIQNGFHNLFSYPHFKVLDISNRFYYGAYSSNPYTLW